MYLLKISQLQSRIQEITELQKISPKLARELRGKNSPTSRGGYIVAPRS